MVEVAAGEFSVDITNISSMLQQVSGWYPYARDNAEAFAGASTESRRVSGSPRRCQYSLGFLVAISLDRVDVKLDTRDFLVGNRMLSTSLFCICPHPRLYTTGHPR